MDYTKVYENIGLTVSAPTVTIGSQVGGQYPVTVGYTVNWNTAALDETNGDAAGIIVWREGWLENDTDWAGWAYAEREVFVPGLVEFTYNVDAPELLAHYITQAGAYGDSWYRGDYIVRSAYVDGDYTVF